LKLGETYKDIHDVVFSNCVIKKSSRAFGIYAKHGGDLYNINLSNIMCNTNAALVLNRPIQIGIWPDSRGRGTGAGKVRNVSISNFTTTTQGRILLTAVEGSMIENITLRDVTMLYPYIEDPFDLAEGTTSNQFAAIDLEAKQARAAIVAQNVKNLVIDNLKVQWPQADTVPAEWQLPERIENGSDRVHRPEYKTSRETEFSVIWGKNLQGGFISAPGIRASDAKTKTTVLIDSDVKIIQ
jgi:hypothetical protein